METTIKKKVTLKQMQNLFESGDLINIRFYKPSNQNFDINNYDGEKLNFDITIRHSENECAKQIFDKAIDKL